MFSDGILHKFHIDANNLRKHFQTKHEEIGLGEEEGEQKRTCWEETNTI